MPTSPSAHRVAQNVRAEIARNGWNQTTLAAKLGRSQQSLSRRLSGVVPFNVTELGEIAAALDVTMTQLVAENTDRVSA